MNLINKSEQGRVLALHIGQTVTRAELLTRVWGKDDPYHSKSMDVYLTRIRKYLRVDGTVDPQNVHGHGYRLVPADGTTER